MISRLIPNLPSAITWVAVGTAGFAATLLALFSLRWPIVHDLPIILYDGYLIQDLGRAPFRDFFETNTPGTMLLAAMWHELTGGASFGARVIDLGVLAAICGATILTLRSHGLKSGVLASACFALAYLAKGPIMSLQREYVSVLPLALSTAILFRADRSRLPGPLVLAVTGLLGGIAASIKPPLLLCWIPLVATAAIFHAGTEPLLHRRLRKVTTGVLLPFLLGLALPLVLILVWLARIGGLETYLEIVRNYYPLYTQLNGNGFLWEAGPQAFLSRYVLKPLQLIPAFPFAVVAFLGLALAWSYRSRDLFLHCLCICGMTAGALLYVAVGGKFWVYHSFPLYFALALLAGLGVSRHLMRPAGEASWVGAILCVALSVGLPLEAIGREYLDWRTGRTVDVKNGRVDLVANYLERHTAPADTVLPLDVTGGAIHAMYRNRRPLYGRFVYDVQFYHHIDDPYIQRLRRELIAEFQNGEPDVVVRFDNTWLRSATGSSRFPELDAILENGYDIAVRENEVSIFRRRAASNRVAAVEASSGRTDRFNDR